MLFRIHWFWAVIVLWITVGTERYCVATIEQPNIVVLFADDLGYGDLSCYGATMVQTPNIDSLARQGRRFSDAHSASAVCTPSRYALITGRYPIRRGNLWGPVFLRHPLVIAPDRVTIGDIAKRAGYSTACIGKWHLGWGNQQPTDWNQPLRPGPNQLGFDYYYGMPTVNSHPPFVYVENDRVVGWDENDPFVYDQKAETRVFDEKMGLNQIGGARAAHALYDDESVGMTLTEKATQWIESQVSQNQPFFLYFATTNIHHPFTPAKQFQGTSEAGPYGDFIHELDWIAGQLMQKLEALEIEDETVFIFTSDNGGMLNRGGQEAYRRGHRQNGELLGFKFDAWEGGHRVPFIVRWPGQIPADSESSALISNVDLMATVAGIVGQELKEGEGIDSVNLVPVLTGPADMQVRNELLLAPVRPANLTLRQGDWVYIDGRGGGGFSARQVGEHGLGGPAATLFTGQENSDIENGRIKPDAPRQQLYNLETDPRQKQNVITQYPDVARRMQQRLQSFRPSAPDYQ